MGYAKSDQADPIKKNPIDAAEGIVIGPRRSASKDAGRRQLTFRSSSRRGLLVVLLALLLCPLPRVGQAEPAACRAISDGDSRYVVCVFDMRQNRRHGELRLFLAGPDGRPYGGLAALADRLKQRGERLVFGMNAGMFQENLLPLGLFIEARRIIDPVNERAGSGNFHLKPNGIFYFGGHMAGVMETAAFVRSGLKPDYATQSGPMLVINGMIHPKIQPNGTSEKIRNGVGVRDGHIVVFAISEDPVTFYRFASLFRDRLGCVNALYLDGSVSSLYAPMLGRADGLRPIGPIVGLVEEAAQQ